MLISIRNPADVLRYHGLGTLYRIPIGHVDRYGVLF